VVGYSRAPSPVNTRGQQVPCAQGVNHHGACRGRVVGNAQDGLQGVPLCAARRGLVPHLVGGPRLEVYGLRHHVAPKAVPVVRYGNALGRELHEDFRGLNSGRLSRVKGVVHQLLADSKVPTVLVQPRQLAQLGAVEELAGPGEGQEGSIHTFAILRFSCTAVSVLTLRAREVCVRLGLHCRRQGTGYARFDGLQIAVHLRGVLRCRPLQIGVQRFARSQYLDSGPLHE